MTKNNVCCLLGFAQTGAWGCFDEFNRINIEVLSVVAQQILSILSALAQGLKKFAFEGALINLVPTCGIFITMNPGMISNDYEMAVQIEPYLHFISEFKTVMLFCTFQLQQ